MKRRAIIGTVIGAMIAFAAAAPIHWALAGVENFYFPAKRLKTEAEAAFWIGWYTLAGAGVGAAFAYFTRPREPDR